MICKKQLSILAAVLLIGTSFAKTASPSMKSSMDTMSMNMDHMQMTGDPDQDFLRMMIVHHQGAVEMAQVEVKTGHDPKLKALAQKMIDDQTKEIKMMQNWPKAHLLSG